MAVAISTAITSTPTSGNFAGRVAIDGGRRIYVECRGSGEPTVILEAGLRVRSDYWSYNDAKPPATSVLPGVAKFTRVCVYDRAGTVIGFSPKDRSRSDPVPMPRSAMSAVEDLHALMQAAKIRLPVVLAGHSTGGLLIRLYAHRYPRDVAGLVLIDALPDGLRRYLTPPQYATFLRLNTEPDGLKSYRDYETIPFDPAFAELRRLQTARPLPRMPLVVVSRGVPVEFPKGSVPPGFTQALERAWRLEQAKLAKLEPDARQIIARRSSHYIMLQQPDLVIRAIREVVDAVRRGNEHVDARAREKTRA